MGINNVKVCAHHLASAVKFLWWYTLAQLLSRCRQKQATEQHLLPFHHDCFSISVLLGVHSGGFFASIPFSPLFLFFAHVGVRSIGLPALFFRTRIDRVATYKSPALPFQPATRCFECCRSYFHGHDWYFFRLISFVVNPRYWVCPRTWRRRYFLI